MYGRLSTASFSAANRNAVSSPAVLLTNSGEIAGGETYPAEETPAPPSDAPETGSSHEGATIADWPGARRRSRAARLGLTLQFESQHECDFFLESAGIRVQALTREALFLASRAWRTYRRQGGKRTRILTDFLIGAHAQKQATRLLSRDRGFYQKLFPSLNLCDPARAK